MKNNITPLTESVAQTKTSAAEPTCTWNN